MKKTIIRIIVLTLLILMSVCIIFLGVGYSKYSNTLKEQNLSSKVEEIQSDENYAKLEDINKFYINAVVAVEDHRFYEHNGIDVLALGRAMLRDIKNRELLEGGSTITQQLAKNTFFTQNKEIVRKVAEGFMALDYEKNYSKDEILELYLNTSYFGDGYYTVKEASLGYFDKLPIDLNEYEASMLAGIPNAPSVYSPTVNFKLASERQNQVLSKMVKYGYITEAKKKEILNQTQTYHEYFNKK